MVHGPVNIRFTYQYCHLQCTAVLYATEARPTRTGYRPEGVNLREEIHRKAMS